MNLKKIVKICLGNVKFYKKDSILQRFSFTDGNLPKLHHLQNALFSK